MSETETETEIIAFNFIVDMFEKNLLIDIEDINILDTEECKYPSVIKAINKFLCKVNVKSNDMETLSDDIDIAIDNFKLMIKKEKRKEKQAEKIKEEQIDDKEKSLELINKLIDAGLDSETETDLIEIKSYVSKLISVKRNGNTANAVRNAKDRARKEAKKSEMFVCPYCNQYRMNLDKFNIHSANCEARNKCKSTICEIVIKDIQHKKYKNFNLNLTDNQKTEMRKQYRETVKAL